MARLPRLTLAGHAHAVLQRGAGTQPVFADDTDRQTYLHALREAMVSERCAVHAFALHDHEVRLLATPESADGLGRLMQAVGRRYVSAYHRRHGGAGSLWAGRFRSAVVEAGPVLLDALLWVDGSLLQASHSSVGHRSDGPRWPWLSDPPEYWKLGNTPFEREDRWRQLMEQGLPAARAAQLQAAVWGGWALGDEAFSREVAASSDRPSRPRARGRPRSA
jgi:putative transposase